MLQRRGKLKKVGLEMSDTRAILDDKISLIGVGELSRRLRVSPKTVRRLAVGEGLPHLVMGPGRRMWFRYRDVCEWMDRRMRGESLAAAGRAGAASYGVLGVDLDSVEGGEGGGGDGIEAGGGEVHPGDRDGGLS